jgi:hypothetical protein
MLNLFKKKITPEILFCPECGSPVTDLWADSVYYQGDEILVRRCSNTNKYGHYWYLTEKRRPKSPKFDPYTGIPRGD